MTKSRPADLRLGQNIVELPHVVVLGAGASVATCPSGDANGHRLPVMRNLVDTVGLASILADAGLAFEAGGNFESLYSSIVSDPTLLQVRQRLEARMYQYFADIQIPDRVTIYDELILSLRRKDLIATFNWDPLLVQAYRRNARLRELPEIAFLHGNVAIGACFQHREKGYAGGDCTECGEPYQQTPLLYPVTNKRYRDDPFIANEWAMLEAKLRKAFMLTIFGYSAPASDIDARAIMQIAWESNERRNMSQIEIVDIRPSREVYENWKEFITRNHYGTSRRISRTWQFQYPRRSCDSLGAAILLLQPWSSKPLPRFRRVDRLQAWCEPLANEEYRYYEEGGPLVPFRKGAT